MTIWIYPGLPAGLWPSRRHLAGHLLSILCRTHGRFLRRMGWSGRGGEPLTPPERGQGHTGADWKLPLSCSPWGHTSYASVCESEPSVPVSWTRPQRPREVRGCVQGHGIRRHDQGPVAITTQIHSLVGLQAWNPQSEGFLGGGIHSMVLGPPSSLCSQHPAPPPPSEDPSDDASPAGTTQDNVPISRPSTGLAQPWWLWHEPVDGGPLSLSLLLSL